ncbi:MAG: class I SAM-dependent methyltransferase [Chitinophagales bacterium]
MAEKKSGLHAIISTPFVYNLVQWVAGARLYRERMTANYIKPFEGCRILDIGCGTGEYVEYFDKRVKQFEYYGFDGEAAYIEWGQQRYRDDARVHLFHKILTEEEIREFNNFDIVIATGVMHHLDDELVVSLLQLAKKALKPGGKLVTYDPGNYQDANAIETFFVNNDRGRSIRFQEGYEALIKQVFPRFTAHVPYLTWFKVRNIVFECYND